MALAAAPSRRFPTAPPRPPPSSPLQIRTHLRPQNPCRSPPPLLAATAAAPLTAADTEGRKHELLRAVQETGRGSGASPDQRAAIEEAIVCVEELGAGEGAPLDLAALDGTWRLCYTSASDVLVLFEAAERLPLLQVGQIYQKFECKGRLDGGIVRNVVRWSIENLLEDQEGATLMVSAKFDVLSKRNIFLQFEEVAVENIKISEQLQALIAPAILPRSFLSLQTWSGTPVRSATAAAWRAGWSGLLARRQRSVAVPSLLIAKAGDGSALLCRPLLEGITVEKLHTFTRYLWGKP